jgi:hypothetical protein
MIVSFFILYCYAECHSAKFRSAECRGAKNGINLRIKINGMMAGSRQMVKTVKNGKKAFNVFFLEIGKS